jgi:hypothetical protein
MHPGAPPTETAARPGYANILGKFVPPKVEDQPIAFADNPPQGRPAQAAWQCHAFVTPKKTEAFQMMYIDTIRRQAFDGKRISVTHF